jgi:hypothetical protein
MNVPPDITAGRMLNLMKQLSVQTDIQIITFR